MKLKILTFTALFLLSSYAQAFICNANGFKSYPSFISSNGAGYFYGEQLVALFRAHFYDPTSGFDAAAKQCQQHSQQADRRRCQALKFWESFGVVIATKLQTQRLPPNLNSAAAQLYSLLNAYGPPLSKVLTDYLAFGREQFGGEMPSCWGYMNDFKGGSEKKFRHFVLISFYALMPEEAPETVTNLVAPTELRSIVSPEEFEDMMTSVKELQNEGANYEAEVIGYEYQQIVEALEQLFSGDLQKKIEEISGSPAPALDQSMIDTWIEPWRELTEDISDVIGRRGWDENKKKQHIREIENRFYANARESYYELLAKNDEEVAEWQANVNANAARNSGRGGTRVTLANPSSRQGMVSRMQLIMGQNVKCRKRGQGLMICRTK